jgi:hypothetical protein
MSILGFGLTGRIAGIYPAKIILQSVLADFMLSEAIKAVILPGKGQKSR